MARGFPEQKLFPILGFKGPSKIKANFGRLPFVFDITQPPAIIVRPKYVICGFSRTHRANRAETYKPGQKVHISELPAEIIQSILVHVGDARTLVQASRVSKVTFCHSSDTVCLMSSFSSHGWSSRKQMQSGNRSFFSGGRSKRRISR